MSIDTSSPLAPEAAPDPNRSAKQIENDIVNRRERLVSTVDEITERVKPANVAAKAKEKAAAQVIDPEHGGVRLNRVLPVVGVVAGLVTLVVARKALHRPTRTEKATAKAHEVADNANDLRDKLVELLTHASEAARVKANQAWEATEATRAKVSEAASTAADTTKAAAQTTREQAVSAAETVSDAAQHSNKRACKLWKKNKKRLPWG